MAGLHHVGHVVRDMAEAMERYRRLGFTVPAPLYPVLSGLSGAAGESFGVINTHVYFPGNFVELVAVTEPPAEARPMPLRVPDDRVPVLAAAIRATAANLASFLDRFQGVHIMIADTSDLDGVASRLSEAGVGHGGVHAIQRPVETRAGTRMEPARYLEISGTAEGRIGFAENAPPETPGDRYAVDHPNGATALVECVLCVADQDLPELARRYDGYFGQAPENTEPEGGAQEGGASEGGAPEGAVPETRAPETRAPEGRVPEGGAQEGGASEGGTPEGRACESGVPEGGVPEGGAQEGWAPESAAPAGPVRRFGRAGVTVVTASALGGLLPGEQPPGLPGFAAYTVSVRDVAATERLLRANDVPVARTGTDEVFVPAEAALGVAVVFRQDGRLA